MIRLHQARHRRVSENRLMKPQNASLPVVENVTRPQAIERIRRVLSALEDDRFYWIARPRPQASREELEELVSAYHLGRQQVAGASLCCDVETRDHCACDGWTQFDNDALETFCFQVTGKKIRIGRDSVP